MKRIAFINTVPYGSTGKIVQEIAHAAEKKGWDTFIYYAWTKMLRNSSQRNVMIGSFLGRCAHLVLGSITGLACLFSVVDTYRLIKQLKRFQPDVLNLHNLHGNYLNLPILFSYIKKNHIKVVWTLHDCWALTGQCVHFTIAKCDKWKTGCSKCPQYRDYPGTYVDQTRFMWKMKKRWFAGIEDMLVVTPSQWLADLALKSMLGQYPVKVINNGINLNIFHPGENDFRKKYACEDKFIILGVAYGWGYKKGLDVFINLCKQLGPEYQMVLVGTDDEVDRSLPEQVISIHRTQNQAELSEIYSASDLLVNASREENYPTVNMESLACGTPVLTFNAGGSAEIIDRTCGRVVPTDDINALILEINRIRAEKPFSEKSCIYKAQNFDMQEKFGEYVALFESICEKGLFPR